MIKPTKNIQDVKQMVKAYDNRHVAVRVNLGRNKTMQFCGVVGGIYPSLFTVRPDKADFLGKTAYSYADVLCGTVSLKLLS
ncbi:MAG: Veg family protein [Clostridia bacterium]|nr:Veg family protein [Clostridia bacterium]